MEDERKMEPKQDYSYRVVLEPADGPAKTVHESRDKDDALYYVDGLVEGIVAGGVRLTIHVYTIGDAAGELTHWFTLDRDDEEAWRTWRKTSMLLHPPPGQGRN